MRPRRTDRRRGQRGFTVIDTILGVFLSFVLVAPVLGGVLLILRVAPGANGESAISVQRRRTAQNFQLAVASAQMRSDWDSADIIRVKPNGEVPVSQSALAAYKDNGANMLQFGSGWDCLGEDNSYVLTPGVRPVASLQVVSLAPPGPSPPGVEFVGVEPLLQSSRASSRNGRPLQSQGIGLTRVVYNLVPKSIVGGAVVGGYDLVRRECAVEANGQPALKGPDPNDGRGANGELISDWQGWRLKPGSAAPGADLIAPVPGQTNAFWKWDNTGPRTVLTGVAQIDVAFPTGTPAECNDDTDNEQSAVPPGTTYRIDCDLTYTVLFVDGRTQAIRLFQGSGSRG